MVDVLDTLNPTQLELIKNHLSFVLEYNKKINLTAITTQEEGLLLHIEDSLQAIEEVNQAPIGALADIGSGGGYPGIPLAIATGRSTTLIEAVKKKAHALELFIEQEKQGINLKVAAQRSEELAREQRGAFSVVTARAVGELPVLIELASPLLAIGGLLICYKGQPVTKELERGRRAANICGFGEETRRSYILSDNTTCRSLVVYRKVIEPTIPLPRRNGIAQKRPLG